MPTIQLRGKVIITGEIVAVTGLHIGGTAAELDIGGIDNPIIRNPVTLEPYIPGSSLRGKMRSLLDRHLGRDANQPIGQVRIHACLDEAEYADCPVCQIFGVTPGGKRKQWQTLRPTRLLVRDVALDKDAKLRTAKTDLPFAEVKTEVAIDRITSAASPRQNERVPPDTVFSPFELVYSLYDLNGSGCDADIDRFPVVIKGMELLEDDYLGGYGSRGAGKIRFEGVTLTVKSQRYYEGKEETQALAEAATVPELTGQSAELTQRLREILSEAG